jgi:hypothetical protein
LEFFEWIFLLSRKLLLFLHSGETSTGWNSEPTVIVRPLTTTTNELLKQIKYETKIDYHCIGGNGRDNGAGPDFDGECPLASGPEH